MGEEAVTAALEAARERGALGPGPVTQHIKHARGFARALAEVAGVLSPTTVLDLGSGGGLPGLVLALVWPASHFVLLDSSERRVAQLTEAVLATGLEERVVARWGRAETVGRDPDLRGRISVVVSRSFGPRAVTAECGAPFLEEGGNLVVSSPPDEEPHLEERWPTAALDGLGLGPAVSFRDSAGYVVLRQARICPSTYPRRDGVPRKRPLF